MGWRRWWRAVWRATGVAALVWLPANFLATVPAWLCLRAGIRHWPAFAAAMAGDLFSALLALAAWAYWFRREFWRPAPNGPGNPAPQHDVQ